MDNAGHRRCPVVHLTYREGLPFLVRDTQRDRLSSLQHRRFTLCFLDVFVHLLARMEKDMQIIVDEMQCFWCENKKLCSRFEPHCNPCDGDSEECLTCLCLNASYERRTKECEHET